MPKIARGGPHAILGTECGPWTDRGANAPTKRATCPMRFA
jgi:hypothetical protein